MQSSLRKNASAINVKGVYKVLNSLKINNKNVILLDDIYTTGNTATECSNMLKKAGAQKILVFTIATD